MTATSAAGMASTFPLQNDETGRYALFFNDTPPFSKVPLYNLLGTDLGDLSCTDYRTAHFSEAGRIYLNVGVRGRGETSCLKAKTSFKIRFNRNRFFRNRRKINYDNLWLDKALIRKDLAWELLKDLNQPYSRTFHVRIHNNGRYHGLFLSEDNSHKQYLQRNDLDAGGDIYKSLTSREEQQGRSWTTWRPGRSGPTRMVTLATS